MPNCSVPQRSLIPDRSNDAKTLNILDKINDVGWDALADEDKEYLNKESKNNHFDEPPN